MTSKIQQKTELPLCSCDVPPRRTRWRTPAPGPLQSLSYVLRGWASWNTVRAHQEKKYFVSDECNCWTRDSLRNSYDSLTISNKSPLTDDRPLSLFRILGLAPTLRTFEASMIRRSAGSAQVVDELISVNLHEIYCRTDGRPWADLASTGLRTCPCLSSLNSFIRSRPHLVVDAFSNGSRRVTLGKPDAFRRACQPCGTTRHTSPQKASTCTVTCYGMLCSVQPPAFFVSHRSAASFALGVNGCVARQANTMRISNVPGGS